eukprot:2059603-Prymnesium_polylepis.1
MLTEARKGQPTASQSEGALPPPPSAFSASRSCVGFEPFRRSRGHVGGEAVTWAERRSRGQRGGHVGGEAAYAGWAGWAAWVRPASPTSPACPAT